MLKFILPFILFILLALFLGVGLKLNPRNIPSPLIDKPAPKFALPSLENPKQILRTDTMQGQVWILNVWASWCSSCRVEHPLWNTFAQAKLVPLIGLNYKDDRVLGLNWLQQLGNPYDLNIMDAEGRTGIDWGIYGVPETFVIDQHNKIRLKITGVISQTIIDQQIKPLISKLKDTQR